jgi:DNA-binding NarL/FixJ family response regulator
MYNNLGRGIRAALDSRPPQLDQVDQLDQHPKEASPSQKEETPAQENSSKGKTLPKEARLPREAASPAGKRKSKKPKLKMQIAELSAQGLSPQQIASRLQLSLAEIDLAFNLLQRPANM